ncbi:MAG: trimethylamine methyltransferase family protein [Planctomycetota bacterium]
MLRPGVKLLSESTLDDIVAEAERVLDEIGVFVEYAPAVDLLVQAGATMTDKQRMLIPSRMVRQALTTAPGEFSMYDREGENPLRIGGDAVHFDPGSAAIKVHDYETGTIRPSLSDDCIRFAQLTEALPHMAMQSTCVVPSDIPRELADSHRLFIALTHGTKPIITGVFEAASFTRMFKMLACVRGSETAVREKPLAVFDCCPSPPLKWSGLTCACLMDCAMKGVPAELVSMPLTGAAAPVTILGALVQHTAESLSGLVIHQLACPGAPIVYGGAPSAFDLRMGTTPMGAMETMMIDVGYAQIGKALGLPTHAYMALSDAKTPDWQAGMEGGIGAVLAALAGVNVVSGPGMLDMVSCQSLENLLLQHEACAMALRLVRGIERRDEVMAFDVLKQGMEQDQFLSLDHTRRWSRKEFYYPGPVIDRTEGGQWERDGAMTAVQRAHIEVRKILEKARTPPLEASVARELEKLATL